MKNLPQLTELQRYFAEQLDKPIRTHPPYEERRRAYLQRTGRLERQTKLPRERAEAWMPCEKRP